MPTNILAISIEQPSMLLFGLYVFAFGITAVACFIAVPRARQITERDTRQGLVALLATSGLWATTHVGYLLAPTSSLQHGFYMLGLIVGIATVGPWLYFCSAYTGRSLHNNTTYRWLAVGTYLVIVAIKLTNPVHGLYYTASPASLPFQHLMIDHGTLHWLAMGLAYSLAIVGIFMLFELFGQVEYNTKPFVGLVAVTATPVVLDIAGYVTTVIIDITYSALGVAVFGLGVLFIYTDQFDSLRLAGQYDNPVIVVDNNREIQEYNPAAETLFPELPESTGREFQEVLPDLATNTEKGGLLEYESENGLKYYELSTEQLRSSRAEFGRLISLTDVTQRERQRQELETQNEQLERFTGTVSHDLRNPLNVAQGNTEIIRELLQPHMDNNGGYEPPNYDTLETVESATETLTRTLTRMESLIEELLVLTQAGKEITDPESVSVEKISKNCWTMVETKDASFVIDDNLTIKADADRLKQLFENLFRNAVEHGGDEVTIRVGELDDEQGFYIEDTGPGIPEDNRDIVFESGFTTNRSGTGLGLSIVDEVVKNHGWQINLSESVEGGTRFEVMTTVAT